jgi:alpha-beta hydrolase superfamily lysophospholipase
LDIEPGAQQGGVRSADILVPDADRGLDLPVRVSFPSATGQYPLVILSHHAGGSRNAYEMLVRSWVARGYIVAQPSHRDAPERGGSRGAMARQAWEDRTRDVRLLVNGAAELERRIPALASKIDRRTAGVAGLYLGALSAELVAGLKMDGRDTMREQRVGAVILLSPQGRGNGKNPDAWSEIRVPMLVITGSGDNSRRTRQGAQWRTDAFHLSALGDKYLLWIEGLDARYGGLVGGDPAGPANAGAREAVLRTTALFWDAHLKGDHDAGVALIGTDAVKTR